MENVIKGKRILIRKPTRRLLKTSWREVLRIEFGKDGEKLKHPQLCTLFSSALLSRSDGRLLVSRCALSPLPCSGERLAE